MIFNSAWVAAVARTSAELCQYVAYNPERLSAEQVLDILCCLPLYHLRRLALCFFSFFCFPPFPSSDRRPFYSSSTSSSDDDGHDSHSD